MKVGFVKFPILDKTDSGLVCLGTFGASGVFEICVWVSCKSQTHCTVFGAVSLGLITCICEFGLWTPKASNASKEDPKAPNQTCTSVKTKALPNIIGRLLLYIIATFSGAFGLWTPKASNIQKKILKPQTKHALTEVKSTTKYNWEAIVIYYSDIPIISSASLRTKKKGKECDLTIF